LHSSRDRKVSRVYCPNIRGGWSFAVAGAYSRWTNLEESDVAAQLAEYRESLAAAHSAS
jgi:hypothetical protein